MNNFCDEEWFGYKDVFNRQAEHEWIPTEDNIGFPDGKVWEDYIDSKRLEITCGEAPYLVSRYDASTGEMIRVYMGMNIKGTVPMGVLKEEFYQIFLKQSYLIKSFDIKK